MRHGVVNPQRNTILELLGGRVSVGTPYGRSTWKSLTPVSGPVHCEHATSERCAEMADGGAPSILLVITDAWRATAFSQPHADADAPDPLASTPHLDALARAQEAVVLSRVYSTHPCCSPSRASIVTGRHAEVHGVLSNGIALATDVPTIGSVLSAQGWSTALVGKWHISSDCFPRPLLPSTAATAAGMRHGFGRWAEDGCNSNVGSHFNPVLLLGNGSRLESRRSYGPTFVTDLAIEWLESTDRRESLFVTVSWEPPHAPSDAPAQARSHVESVETAIVNSSQPEFAHILKRNAWNRRGADQMRQGGQALLWPDLGTTASRYPELGPNAGRMRRGTAAHSEVLGYFANVRALDAEFGRLLKAFDACREPRRSIVAFTSDHGEMLHSHALLGKHKPWEESARVPLLLRLPAATASHSTSLRLAPLRRYAGVASNADLAPTLLGLVGLPASLLCGGCGERCATGDDLSPALLECVARDTCEPGDLRAPRVVSFSTLHWLGVATADLKAIAPRLPYAVTGCDPKNPSGDWQKTQQLLRYAPLRAKRWAELGEPTCTLSSTTSTSRHHQMSSKRSRLTASTPSTETASTAILIHLGLDPLELRGVLADYDSPSQVELPPAWGDAVHKVRQ